MYLVRVLHHQHAAADLLQQILLQQVHVKVLRSRSLFLTVSHGHAIGSLLDPANSITENCRSAGELFNAEKYSFLYHRVQSPKILPSTFSHGCNWKFNISWLEKHSWLQYSPKLDGVFCGPCALLLSEGN